jgi:AcrR family transcriptional regulator
MAEPPRTRSPNAERTRTEILDVATAEFARHGYAGVRIDQIAALTRTTKRMIYYYFGTKERLYLAVLHRSLASVRPRPGAAAPADPLGLIVQVAGLTYERYRADPDAGRVLITENLSGGTHLSGEPGAPEVELLEQALRTGVAEGLIRPGITAGDLLMIINSLCQFAIANRHTHHRLCGYDPLGEESAEAGRRVLVDVVTAYLSPAGRDGGA